jgi:hypothetical protein
MILDTENTEELRSLSNRIKNVDEKSWRRRTQLPASYYIESRRERADGLAGVTRISKTANLHKFTLDNTESRELLNRLKELGKRELIFADPLDAVLGIGINAADAEEVDRAQWGANVFGKSLDAVRDHVEVEKRKNARPRKKVFSPPAMERRMSRECGWSEP